MIFRSRDSRCDVATNTKKRMPYVAESASRTTLKPANSIGLSPERNGNMAEERPCPRDGDTTEKEPAPGCGLREVPCRRLSKGGFQALYSTPQFANVQCEACHGPGGVHAEKPRKGYGYVQTPSDCVTCHTRDNSPDFNFAAYWPKIKH